MAKNVIPVDENSFQKMVIDSDLPVLVDFSATWCGPCRMIEPLLEDIAGTKSEQVRVVKVDIDSNKQLTLEYQIRSVPTLMLFSKGQPVKTHVGIISRDKLDNFIS